MKENQTIINADNFGLTHGVCQTMLEQKSEPLLQYVR